VLDQADRLDRVFQALADPSRRLMVERLSRGPASVSELARPFSMSLAAVVQHVQVLEACGLVRSEKVGRVRTCQIAPATLRSAERWIAERRSTWERRLDALGDYLAGQPDPDPDPAVSGPVHPAESGPVHPAVSGPVHPVESGPVHPDQGSIR
jgi:DNA-binding transcriptional ArsR family regulator